MIVAEITVTGARAIVTAKSIITAGMVGAKIRIDYQDPKWDGLRKTVVFSGTESRDVISDDPEVTIPSECVAKPIQFFRVGVYGVDPENNLVIPTLWANIGPVLDAADPSGDTSTDPTLPIWAQLQSAIGDLGNLTTDAKNNLVAAINEAARTGGGGSAADMVLDVHDGYIRYSIDGGETWENLIAVSDLTGPQGEPGTDATVTTDSIQNALGYIPADEQEVAKVPEFSGTPAVGQIYKVSNVGEDGKVTMEPVDMPPSDKWELIHKYTFQDGEASNKYVINQDMSGNGFVLKSIFLELLIPGTGSQEARNGRITANKNDQIIQIVDLKGVAVKNKTLITVRAAKLCDMLEVIAKTSTAGGYHDLDNMDNNQWAVAANVSSYWASTIAGHGKYVDIQSLTIDIWNANEPLAAGTEINLYGVRA